MRKRHRTRSNLASAVSVLILLASAGQALAQTERVLHSFSGADGATPYAGLVSDGAGNLYGTTVYGGANVCPLNPAGCGVVFEVTRGANGVWTERVLHNFANNGRDGYYPYAGLTIDTAGNLYGTTTYGGDGPCSNGTLAGCGTVFELTRTSGGGWAEKILYSFGGSSNDGAGPEGGLILDDSGNLYGTTYQIAEDCSDSPGVGCGTVFELIHHGRNWTEKMLHSFANNGTDGFAPYGNLSWDTHGNLVGGTYWGGAGFNGIAFELTPGENGTWTENVLYSFSWRGINGGGPGGLTLDASGNLYGSAALGGSSYSGEVFELTPATGESWNEATLFNFDIYSTGASPNGGLVFDNAGNLYGTDMYGGAGTGICYWWGGGTESASCGTVFKLTPGGGGNWTQTIVHSFGDGMDGQVPYAGLLLGAGGAGGRLFGTTSAGGVNELGTVFEILP